MSFLCCNIGLLQKRAVWWVSSTFLGDYSPAGKWAFLQLCDSSNPLCKACQLSLCVGEVCQPGLALDLSPFLSHWCRCSSSLWFGQPDMAEKPGILCYPVCYLNAQEFIDVSLVGQHKVIFVCFHRFNKAINIVYWRTNYNCCPIFAFYPWHTTLLCVSIVLHVVFFCVWKTTLLWWAVCCWRGYCGGLLTSVCHFYGRLFLFSVAATNDIMFFCFMAFRKVKDSLVEMSTEYINRCTLISVPSHSSCTLWNRLNTCLV